MVDELQLELEDSYGKEQMGFEHRVIKGDFGMGGDIVYKNAAHTGVSGQQAIENAYAKAPRVEGELVMYRPFMEVAGRVYDARFPGNKFDESFKAEWMLKNLSWFENNLTRMVWDTEKLKDADAGFVEDFAAARSMYLRTDISSRQVWEGAKAVMSDPFTYLGFGLIGKAVAAPLKSAFVSNVLNKLAGTSRMAQKTMQYGTSAASGGAMGYAAGATDGGVRGYSDETIKEIAQKDPFEWRAVASQAHEVGKIGGMVGIAGTGLMAAGGAAKALWDKYRD